jgi:enoyl-CoA hydratase/carnithine racemase
MEIRVDAPKPHITLVTIAYEARRNAMTRAMMADLAELWDRLDRDPECRAVILTGAGERSFCVGADISGDLSASPEMAHVINRALLKDTPFSKPIIAAINGDCVGGGVELLLSTDIRMAVPTARFGLPEVKWSIYPFGGATVKLARQIGHVHAMDLLLTGRLIDAGFAEKIGLINGIVEPDRLMQWALETAETIAANSPSAVQAVKEQISTTSADFAKSREATEQALGDRVRASPHFAEGVAAFREKRRPNYSRGAM